MPNLAITAEYIDYYPSEDDLIKWGRELSLWADVKHVGLTPNGRITITVHTTTNPFQAVEYIRRTIGAPLYQYHLQTVQCYKAAITPIEATP